MATDLLVVKSNDLTPCQQVTRVGFKRRADCYQRFMVKFPQLAVFHSRAEYYHAALLEGDSHVSAYVPQPFSLRVGREYYTPDCYLVRASQRTVVEIKPRGEFDERKQRSLSAYFARFNMHFEVLANEDILSRSIEAENWLTIIAVLYTHQSLDTDPQEIDLLDRLSYKPPMHLGDLVDPGDRLGSQYVEVALFRLLHRGVLRANLAQSPLDYETEFGLCT